jgi:hypothetical protein
VTSTLAGLGLVSPWSFIRFITEVRLSWVLILRYALQVVLEPLLEQPVRPPSRAVATRAMRLGGRGAAVVGADHMAVAQADHDVSGLTVSVHVVSRSVPRWWPVTLPGEK